jgi:hypothetical protein
LAGDGGGGAMNGSGYLKNFGEEDYTWIFPFGRRPENVGAHGAGGSRDDFYAVIFDGHG